MTQVITTNNNVKERVLIHANEAKGPKVAYKCIIDVLQFGPIKIN